MQNLSVAKQKKSVVISALSDLYSVNGSWVFLVKYDGLDAKKEVSLRSSLRKVGAKMVVAKNTLNAIAMKGTGFSVLEDSLAGQIATVVGSDCVSIAKELYDRVKEGVSVVAYSDGSSCYDSKSLEKMAKLPSFDVLRAQLLGLLLSVPQKFVRLLMEPHTGLVRVMYERSKNES